MCCVVLCCAVLLAVAQLWGNRRMPGEEGESKVLMGDNRDGCVPWRTCWGDKIWKDGPRHWET